MSTPRDPAYWKASINIPAEIALSGLLIKHSDLIVVMCDETSQTEKVTRLQIAYNKAYDDFVNCYLMER